VQDESVPGAGTWPDGVLDVLIYLVIAADLCTVEPLHYGTFRLIDAAGRLAGVLADSGAADDRPWIRQLRDQISAHKELIMHDSPAFEQFLHASAALVADRVTADRAKRSAPAGET
jgi:hypothetical protein